jgi:hypothetical protein
MRRTSPQEPTRDGRSYRLELIATQRAFLSASSSER